jgi:hypothetical protein
MIYDSVGELFAVSVWGKDYANYDYDHRHRFRDNNSRRLGNDVA